MLWPTREEATRAPRGELQLGFCPNCGHVFNLAFSPALLEYTQDYENSLHFSPRFRSYAESLAKRLIEHYDLHGKHIIEIGCGRGEFLALLCKTGGNRGVGFDPTYTPEKDADSVAEVLFIQDYYSERYGHYKADLICCRQVLEHIESPRDFLADVRRTIGNRLSTAVFFEVPNATFTLRDLGIWDLIYEHPSYYSASSLSWLFTFCGFDVRDLYETYGGQFLCLEAVPNKDSADDTLPPLESVDDISCYAAAFAERYRKIVGQWQRALKEIAHAGRQVVVWGGGSKGVSFVNTLKTPEIEFIVDINPRKHGMYVPGTGQRIVPPTFLRDYEPDVVIVMNPIYQDEIQQHLESLGLHVELVGVLN